MVIVLNILLTDFEITFRYVVHAKVPPTIEDYYQQCGRAGRDGQESVCCMFYSPTDKTALLRMFHQQNLFAKQTKHLNDLIILLEDLVQCRHKNIMTYYGEDCDGFMCGTSCDNCINRGRFVATDGSSDALKVVQAVMELPGK
jgi:superfamily II DNA helicase RecQ